jgi:amino-acid N-acetyltransferase
VLLMGAALVRTALAAADACEQGRAGVGLLTTTAAGYFDRFGFTATDRAVLPAALSASAELTGLPRHRDRDRVLA